MFCRRGAAPRGAGPIKGHGEHFNDDNLTITNRGRQADALIAASTPAAARVEIHHTTLVDGMARMRPLAEIPIPAGATVKIEPGGMHLMLVDLGAPLVAGKPVPLTLVFRVAGRVTVDLAVEAPRAPL